MKSWQFSAHDAGAWYSLVMSFWSQNVAGEAAEAKVSGWSSKVAAEVLETPFAVRVGELCQCPKAHTLLKAGT